MENLPLQPDDSKKTKTAFELIVWRLPFVLPAVYLVYVVAISGAPANVALFVVFPIILICCGLVFSRTAIGFGISLALYLFVGLIFLVLKGAIGLR